jgi:hypothetical protein
MSCKEICKVSREDLSKVAVGTFVDAVPRGNASLVRMRSNAGSSRERRLPLAVCDGCTAKSRQLRSRANVHPSRAARGGCGCRRHGRCLGGACPGWLLPTPEGRNSRSQCRRPSGIHPSHVTRSVLAGCHCEHFSRTRSNVAGFPIPISISVSISSAVSGDLE